MVHTIKTIEGDGKVFLRYDDIKDIDIIVKVGDHEQIIAYISKNMGIIYFISNRYTTE